MGAERCSRSWGDVAICGCGKLFPQLGRCRSERTSHESHLLLLMHELAGSTEVFQAARRDRMAGNWVGQRYGGTPVLLQRLLIAT